MAPQVSAKGSRTFLDTNILVYAEDPIDPAKQRKAQQLIVELRRNRTGVVSLQVLQEFFTSLTRKLKMDAEFARRRVELHAGFQVFQPAVGDILAAIDLHRLHAISFWDALIIRAAMASGSLTVCTEDMQHGQVISGVRIVNPFL